MTQQLSPWLETAYGWGYGENGWNAGMDSNLLKFSVMFDRNVDSIVASLPPAVNGQVHYNTSDNRLYFAVGTTYFSSPTPKWFTITERSTGDNWQFNGTALEGVSNAATVDSRLDAAEVTLTALGSAAFEDVGVFATTSQLDILEAQSESYTDALRQDLADPSEGSGLVAWIRSAVGAVGTTVAKVFTRSPVIEVFDFMSDAQILDVQTTSVLDHTTAITAALTHAFTVLPCTVKFGKGKFNYSSMPNLAKTGLSVRGEGVKETDLAFTGTGSAIIIDAFASGSPADPFAQKCNLSGFTVTGNSNTTRIIDAQGIARSAWKDINVREANPTTGVGFHFRGVMLSKFDNLTCSTDLNPMTNKPNTGLYMYEGRRAGVSVGNSSNNTLRNTYMEGLSKGIDLALADQNEFIGGSPESCTTYGLVVGSGSRYNSFRGVGFESPTAVADIADAGISTLYSNCYSSKSVVLQGRQARIDGGFFERIEIQGASAHNSIHYVTINHWATGSGGFIDNGTATHYGRIYDSDLATFVYPKASRASITVTASPFTYTNTTGMHTAVIIQGGTVTQVRAGDGSGDLWLTSPLSPSTHILRPGDVIEVSYSVAPSMSRVTFNEL